MKKSIIFCVIIISVGFIFLKNYNHKGRDDMSYKMISEENKHEGTWLIWPHKYAYGDEYKDEVEEIWVKITQALHLQERVHIIAYNEKEKIRITNLLDTNGVNMNSIDFTIAKSNDFWVRDTGPIFVKDENGCFIIADFKFDGWGKKAKYRHDDEIPKKVSTEKNIKIIDINDFVLEGGSIEIDGNGTFMGTKSSIISKNRNEKLTIEKAEEHLSKYLGVKNFIWLDGVVDEDITDAHIDGIARFVDDKRILTVSREEFGELYEGINMDDYDKINNAKNINGKQYEIIEMPLTKSNPRGLEYKGSYLNYYIGNSVVLLPVYNNENDKVAIDIISKLYRERRVIPIDVNSLYKYGGMIHCITQQQPN
ncbi:agmatine deiminase family protein [Clostridium hydrogeniformans]|uniref:agmatine deiminase family protein n=1 Tax=Clostridium hydrogeniformans TaxID=349933 RepID=UPI000483FCC0|nr:agmatine deiminase family protein [Clostridium hydrogeniformans]